MISDMSIDNWGQPLRLSSQAIINKYDKNSCLSLFLEDILGYNKKINLVSRETGHAGLIKIAADCLAPFEFLPPPTGKIFDIGPGAGFPSIVLLLSFSGLSGILFERTGKKADFLRQTVKKLNINAEVVPENFTESAKKYNRIGHDYGFMKYVKIDRDILSAALGLLGPNGKFIYYSRLEANMPGTMSQGIIKSFTYYLDDEPQIRTITIFSSIK
jgi:16S rRNA G527 N7-methylase RsmG